MVDIAPLFIAAGVNRTAQAVALSPRPTRDDAAASAGLAAYACANFVAVFELQDRAGVHASLTFPPASADKAATRVNCLIWLDAFTLCAGNSDGFVAIWRRASLAPGRRCLHSDWTCLFVWQAHDASVTCLSSLTQAAAAPGALCVLLASASIDATVRVHRLDVPASGEPVAVALTHRMAASGKRTVEALSLVMLPRLGAAALAYGGTDKRVYLALQRANGTFVPVITLNGHEDCIRSLAWSLDDATRDLLLASASQDNRVRIWRLVEADLCLDDTGLGPAPGAAGAGAAAALQPPPPPPPTGGAVPLPAGVDALDVEETGEAGAGAAELVMRSQLAHVPSRGVTLRMALDSILIAHEDWLVSVAWHPPRTDGSHPMVLLTASMDRTMMLWRLGEADDKVWSTTARFGMMGGNWLGYTGAVLSHDGSFLLGATHQSSLHLWRASGRDDGVASEIDDSSNWAPVLVGMGHGGPVRDCAWTADARLLLSVSRDQTTRLFGEWQTDDGRRSWHELSRPQIHGYDLNTLCVVPASRGYRFVSGADEKIPRVFDVPRLVAKSLNATCAAGLAEADIAAMPIGANVPALGLSNKAVADGEEGSRPAAPTSLLSAVFESEMAVPFAAAVLAQPPPEDHLVANTLWPETHKLYGHGFEVSALACNGLGSLVASASRASCAEDAVIRMWRTDSWQQVASIAGHHLTVVQLAFSPNSELLLSVSRDRSWAVHAISFDGTLAVAQLVQSETAHTRIVWSCAWAPCGEWFATGSRDRTVGLWRRTESGRFTAAAAPSTKAVGSAVTAVGFAPHAPQRLLLAVGFESGAVLLFSSPRPSAPDEALAWTALASALAVPRMCAHSDTVTRLAWRCNPQDGGLVLASCSEDHSVRLYSVRE